MNPLVGGGEAEEVRRPLSVFKRFYNFLHGVLVTFCTLLLEPVFDLLAFFIPRGTARHLLFGSLMQWLPIYGSERVPSGYNGRVKSKNLVTKCLIGKGSSGIFYEITWLGCSQGSSGRLARKDFPGVKGDIFEREVIPLFELPDHPNLLKTLCWTVDNRSCSLVMEYMRDDLSSVVRRKKEELRKKQANQPGIVPAAPIELHEALEIAIQIATGMQYLHLKGIAHGDLKANNIFIDWKEGKMLVKLADFGLLRTKRRSSMVSQRAFCFQIIEWSAPELFEDYFRSTSEDLDYLWTKPSIGLETSTSSVSILEKYTEVSMTQADSYSFALVCAFVLGGQMWNAKLSPSELRKEISNSGLRPTLPSECPKTLRSLISLCWDANPASRPTFSYILKKLQEEQRNLQEGDLSSLEPVLVAEEPLLSRESISNVLIRRESNQDAFNDFHGDRDIFISRLPMEKLESTSEGLRSVMLTNIEEEKLVVSDKIAGTSHGLPSYLNIDLATVTVRYSNPTSPNKRMSLHDPVDESALLHFGNWLGCDYAVKVFKAVDRSEYFMNVEALTKLHHPNIVQLVGFGENEEKSLTLMELMDTDLRSFMHSLIRQRDRPFSLSQELDIISQIAKGLYYLHEQRFSHGDLRCSNILVKQIGDRIDVKLTDFRLSENLRTWDPVSFKEKERYRRPRWSAPEIYSYGEVEPTHALLKKADVYSFGMVCYEVVTGKYPFHDLRGRALQEQIATGVLRQDLPSELDGDLRWLIESCWERDPNARPTLDKICHMLSGTSPVTSTRPENAIDLRSIKRTSIHEHYSLTDASFKWTTYQPRDESYSEEYSNAVPWTDCVEINPDNLKFLRLIGKGATADVYEGTWLWSNVAVKTYRNFALHNLIQNELNFFIKLRHPCIVQFMGISIHPKRECSVVMELMEGDLRQLIEFRKRQKSEARGGLVKQETTVESGNFQELLDLIELKKVTWTETVHVMPFDLREAVYIMRRIALGIAFLHSKGVAHRDLKSTNILVPTHAGSIDVKIADFGLSHHIDSRKKPIRGVGTRFWMAPEIFPWKDKVDVVGDDEPYDLNAADVYSFAMTCYEILTGQVPFQDQEECTKESLKLAITIEGLRPTLPSDELISADLRRLIEQCWDKQPEKRPTFSYICIELQRIQEAMTTEQNLDDDVLKH